MIVDFVMFTSWFSCSSRSDLHIEVTHCESSKLTTGVIYHNYVISPYISAYYPAVTCREHILVMVVTRRNARNNLTESLSRSWREKSTVSGNFSPNGAVPFRNLWQERAATKSTLKAAVSFLLDAKDTGLSTILVPISVSSSLKWVLFHFGLLQWSPVSTSNPPNAHCCGESNLHLSWAWETLCSS